MLDKVIIERLSSFDFSCKRCSSCCRHTPGTVYLTQEDVEKLLANLKMDLNTFINKCCSVLIYEGKDLVVLKEKKNHDCIFWSNGCIVYESRPLQCRSYPFWPEVVNDPEVRKEETKRCPGIDTPGDITLDQKIAYYTDRQNSIYFEFTPEILTETMSLL